MAPPKSKYIDLQFVNITTPREHKNVAHQKAIKKHNMLRYWRGRNKGSPGSCSSSKRRLLPVKGVTGRALNGKANENESENENENEFLSLTIGDPRDRLGSGAQNPFANFAIPAAPYIDELLRYWLTHLGSAFCTIEGPTKATNSALDVFLPLVIGNAAMFHALLAVSSSLIDSSYGRKTPSTRTLEHMGKVITLVSETLNDARHATSDEILLTICLMTASHCIFKDYSNHELHVNGMHQIILLRGGIENIRASPLVYPLILWADRFRGLYTSTPPRYRVASSHFDFASVTQPAPENMSSNSEERWSARDILSNRFIILVEQIADLEQFIESSLGASISSATSPDFYSKRERIKEFLIESVAETYITTAKVGVYEQCCLLAASLYFHVVVRPYPIWWGVQHILLVKLKNVLMKTDSVSCWGDDIELLLWVLMQAAAVDDPLKPWFTQLLKHVIQTFVPRPSLKRVKYILRRFLWKERTSGPACEKLYKEIGDSL